MTLSCCLQEATYLSYLSDGVSTMSNTCLVLLAGPSKIGLAFNSSPGALIVTSSGDCGVQPHKIFRIAESQPLEESETEGYGGPLPPQHEQDNTTNWDAPPWMSCALRIPIFCTSSLWIPVARRPPLDAGGSGSCGTPLSRGGEI